MEDYLLKKIGFKNFHEKFGIHDIQFIAGEIIESQVLSFETIVLKNDFF